jgi:mannose-6-phosphate isomerase
MDVFEKTASAIEEQGLKISSFDFERPWGGFFVIEESQAQDFAKTYFDNINVENLRLAGKLSPKILVIKPNARLSWQYHHRRAETWRIVQGPVEIITSHDDTERFKKQYETGENIVLKQGERHRLVGLSNWSIVAEFWQHTDPTNPSSEEDIVRVQDDFDRK